MIGDERLSGHAFPLRSSPDSGELGERSAKWWKHCTSLPNHFFNSADLYAGSPFLHMENSATP
jgi:hypothetical protein